LEANPVYKPGQENVPYFLQTHARPGLEADHLYWGMLQQHLWAYAEAQQWVRREDGTYLVGGGGIYTPEGQLVFIQDAVIRVNLRQGRLVGLQVLPTEPLDPLTMTQWARAWFPDDVVALSYQSDGQRVLQALLGDVPSGFVAKFLVSFRTIQLGNPYPRCSRGCQN